MDRPSMLKPTLIGGGVAGLIGGLPLIGAINACCCALIIGGGFLAAFLYSNECKGMGAEFRAGAGAKIGLVAGLFYWLVNSIVQGLVSMVFGQPDFAEILEQMETAGAPPELLDQVEPLFEILSGGGGVALVLIVSLVLAIVFSTIGGLIGGAVFKVEPSPPTSPAPPAPPVTPGGGGATGA